MEVCSGAERATEDFLAVPVSVESFAWIGRCQCESEDALTDLGGSCGGIVSVWSLAEVAEFDRVVR